jgi:hypothetical protein
MKRQALKRRRLIVAALLTAVIAAMALGFVPAALEGTTKSRLHVSVVATNSGPLSPCSGSDCTSANQVSDFIYVVNANRLTNSDAGTNRATVPNAFVVSSIDSQIFVNGVEVPGFAARLTPPPNAFFRSWSGHWPSTVTCPPDGTPCNVVGSPAVVPGETAAILYYNWRHGNTEPNGTYVFRYTIHGTLNGNPVDLTVSSPPIEMTA